MTTVDSLGLLASLAGLLGLCVGSFLNVVIYRLPIMLEREWQAQCHDLLGTAETSETTKFNLATPRSRCPNCQHPIGLFENIPVISYCLVLRGKCSACKTAISWRYPLIETLTGVLSAFAAWHFGQTWATVGALILIWCLICLTFIDLDTCLLPDAITLPLLWAGLAFNLSATLTTTEASLIGAMAGYLSLWSVYWLFKLATGKEGMGYGDFKLLAALGAWLGWQLLPSIVLLSSIVGAVSGGLMIVFAKHGRNKPIPFGPYLAIAGLIALFWGQQLTEAYLGLLY